MSSEASTPADDRAASAPPPVPVTPTSRFRLSREIALRLAIRRRQRPGDRVAVGVSGGKDSLSLLKILHEINGGKSGQKYQLVALTVDEGVKGYRDEAIEHARAACEELGVEVGEFDPTGFGGRTLFDTLA